MDRPTLTLSGPRARVHPEACGPQPAPPHSPHPVLLSENPVPLCIDTLFPCPSVGPLLPSPAVSFGRPYTYEYAVLSLLGGQMWAASMLALQVGSELFGQGNLGSWVSRASLERGHVPVGLWTPPPPGERCGQARATVRFLKGGQVGRVGCSWARLAPWAHTGVLGGVMTDG